jgi:uncharacterized cupin superfamily protein
MVPEAPLTEADGGLAPGGDGWFVLNARDARWLDGEMGVFTTFAGERRFEQLGFNLAILRPGEPNGMYHAENAQEDFLVLSGECLLIVEGQERKLGAWDFVHCPPDAEHILVGTGDRPCLIVMVGARPEGQAVRYPVSELARKHGASVDTETGDPREAYAAFAEDRPVSCPPEFPAT